MGRYDRKLKNKRLFIDATMELIETEGIEGVSIRKVAAKTGFNSATLYSYFKNLDHLILLASLKFLKGYVDGLDTYIKDAKNNLEKFNLIWEFFCKCSFQNAKIYEAVFFSKINFNRKDFENFYEIKEYYEIYPEDINKSFSKLHRMILKLDIYERNKILLIELAREGVISSSHINDINNMQIFIYKGLLQEAAVAQDDFSIRLLEKRAKRYLKYQLNPFVINSIS